MNELKHPTNKRMFSSTRYEYYIKHDIEAIKQAILLDYISSVNTETNKKTKFECLRCCELSYMESLATALMDIFPDSTITIREHTDQTSEMETKTFYKLTVDWSITQNNIENMR